MGADDRVVITGGKDLAHAALIQFHPINRTGKCERARAALGCGIQKLAGEAIDGPGSGRGKS